MTPLMYRCLPCHNECRLPYFGFCPDFALNLAEPAAGVGLSVVGINPIGGAKKTCPAGSASHIKENRGLII